MKSMLINVQVIAVEDGQTWAVRECNSPIISQQCQYALQIIRLKVGYFFIIELSGGDFLLYQSSL